MRLEELFETFIKEDPEEEEEVTNQRRTVTFSATDVYLMSMLPMPKRLNKQTGKMVIDPKDNEQRTYVVGTEPGMVDPKFAAGISQWKKDGSVPGKIRDLDTGELVPYDSNTYLGDVGRTLTAATLELGANLTRMGATGLDYLERGDQKATDFILTKFGYPDVIDSDGPMQFPYTKAATGTKENPMWLDAWAKSWEESTDLKYQDEKDLTAGAVNSFSDLGGLFLGTSGATWGGAFALLAGELPSEVVDVMLLAGTSWWTGGALNVAFNASEAGGAAAFEIQRKIEEAHTAGTLQKTAHWGMNMQAAKDMIEAEGTVYESDLEYNNAVEKLAMDQTVYAAWSNGLMKVAATAGLLDTVADRLMIRPPIPSKHVKNAFLKKVVDGKNKVTSFAKGSVTEMGQEGLEQILVNLAVIHATGDEKVVTTYEGVVNAMYNSVYGTAASGVVQGGVSTAKLGSKGTKATYAQLRRFFAGEGTVEDLFKAVEDGDMDAFQAAVRNNDPDSEKFGQLDFVGALKRRDANFVTVDDLSKKDRQKFLDGTLTRKDQRDGFVIDGKKYDVKTLEQNTKDAELMSMFQNSVNMATEGKVQSTFENKEQVKYVAQRLGVYVKGDDLNKMMSKLEDVTKMDIRIAGSSSLEAPLWSELDALQKRQFVTDGVVRFNNHPERGNQTWTREKVMYTSRINGETLPSEVQNLANNVEARPTANQNNITQLNMENDIVRNAEATAFQDFTDEQQMWDEDFGATHNPDGSPKDPNAPGDAGRQLTADDTTDELQGRRPDKNMEHYQKIAQNKLLSNNDYRNAKKRLEDSKERFAKELKDAQDKWDQKNSTTHHTSGVAKIDSKFIDGPPVGPGASSVSSDGSSGDTSSGTDNKVDTTKSGELDTTITKKDLEGPNVDIVAPTTSLDKRIAEAQIVYRMKMNVADGGYVDKQELSRTLGILEQDYPGITKKVLTTDINTYFENSKEIQNQTEKELETAEKPVFTPSSRPPEGAEVELNGTTYRWLGKEAGRGGMWAEVKSDGTRGTTNHQNHSKLNDKHNSTKNTLSKENVSEIGFGEVDTTPANTQDSIKTAQDQVAPNLSPDGPNASGAVVKKEVLPPNTVDSIKTAQDQVTPNLSTTTQGDGAGQDNNPNTDGGQVSTTTPGGRGTPETPAQSAERARIARQAQQRADKIKADAEREKAKADADNIGLDTTAQGDGAGQDNNPNTDGGQTRTTRQGQNNNPNTDGGQASTGPNVQTSIKIPKAPSGSETSPKFEPITDKPKVKTKAPVQPETPKFDPASTPDFTPLDTPKIVGQPGKLKTPKKDVLPGVNPDLVPDAVTGPKKTLTKKQRDALAGRLDTDSQDDADSIDIDTTTSTDDTLNVDTAKDKDTTQKDVGPIVAPKVTIGKDAKPEKGVTRTRDIDTKTRNTRKTVGFPYGGGKKKKDPVPLPKYTPMKISDPLQLDKYKSVGKDRGF